MSDDKARKRESALLRVIDNPIRLNLANRLWVRPATAAQLAAQTGLPADKVRYHLRVLRREGIIDSARQEVRRGVVEQTYFTREEMIVDDDEFATLDDDRKRQLARHVLQVSFRDATDALLKGPGSGRVDDLLARTPLDLDEEGWLELSRIHRRAFEEVQELKAAAAERLRRGGAEPVRATSILMCFEGPVDG